LYGFFLGRKKRTIMLYKKMPGYKGKKMPPKMKYMREKHCCKKMKMKKLVGNSRKDKFY